MTRTRSFPKRALAAATFAAAATTIAYGAYEAADGRERALVPEPIPVAQPFVLRGDGVVAGSTTEGFATAIDARGAVELATADARRVGLRFVGIAREGRSPEGGTADVSVEAGRAVVTRGSIREWYVRGASGLEQGFDLLARPAGTGPLRVELALRGMRGVADGDGVQLVGDDGTPLYRYDGLVAVDAEGRRLPSSIATDGATLALHVDDAAARYPVRIDPFVSTLFATLVAPSGDLAANLGCGAAVAIVGGLAAVGCPAMSGPAATTGAGAVLLFQRNGSGTNTSFTYVSTLRAPSPVAGGRFGHSLAFDGARLVVGSPGETVESIPLAGRAYVFEPTGIGSGWAVTDVFAPTDPSPSLTFGSAVALDGDDVAVGAIGGAIAGSGASSGSVYLFDLAASVPFVGEIGLANGVADDGFGLSVALGDGYLFVGAPGRDSQVGNGAGAVYAFGLEGSAPGAVLLGEVPSPTPAGDVSYGVDVAYDAGRDRLVVGCPRCATMRGAGAGQAFVFDVAPSTYTHRQTLFAQDGAANEFFGTSVAIDDDLVVVGAPGVLLPSAGTKIGAAYVFVDEGDVYLPGSKLRPGDAATGDSVGFSVALDRDADEVILGLPGDGISNLTAPGTARVYGVPAFSFVYANLHGGGSGTVNSTPDGIVCPDGCAAVYAEGASVTLVATPTAGSYVANVAGACTTTPCMLTVGPGDTSVDVTFELQKAPGAVCSRAVECLSGQCVDGVCCNVACGGGVDDCQACSLEAGGSTDGQCTALVGDVARVTECRPAAADCDAPEFCVETSLECPMDRPLPSTHVCRAAVHPICDQQESCDGVTFSCPTDVRAGAGADCDDGLVCNGIEACNAFGACVSTSAPSCAGDGDPCTVDLCVDPVGCIHVAQPGCIVVDGGAVFVDAGVVADAGSDADVDASTVPRPPTFQGEGGCSCATAGGRTTGPGQIALLSGFVWVVLALRRRGRRAPPRG